MLKVLDLYCGAGGLAEGFGQVRDENGKAAFRTVGGVDLWEAACDSFAANHGVRPVCDEVSEASVRTALNGHARVDVIAGGPPCQGFSTSGKRALEDPRNGLVLRFLEAVKLLKPKAFVLENVQGFTTFQNGLLLDEVLEFVEKECRYVATPGILLASLYGAPQRRRRFILVGTREPGYAFPDPEVPAKAAKSVAGTLFDLGPASASESRLVVEQEPGDHREATFREATDDLPPVAAGRSSDRYASKPNNDYQRSARAGVDGTLEEHVAPRHSEKILGMMAYIPEGKSALDPDVLRKIPEELQPKSGFPNSYARIRWDRPAPTITRNFTTPSSANCIHPEQDRALTLREGARCQTFRDGYRFAGSFGDKRLLIGNAVPPFLARALGRSLLRFLS